MTEYSLRAIAAVAAIALPCCSCSFSPLNHRINVGEEPFVIFVGEGINHNTDLFAAPAGGGAISQVTFTPMIERDPRLTSTGEVVAFLRMRDTLPTTHRDITLMNLSSGSETVLPLASGAGEPVALAWAAGATTLYIRTDRGLWQSTVPPHAIAVTLVPVSDTAAADSAFDLWLGRPPIARVIDCASGGLCSIGPRGDTSALAPHGTGAMRWGDDSVAWWENNDLVVRSLGPGRERRVSWKDAPLNPRDGSYAPGAVVQAP